MENPRVTSDSLAAMARFLGLEINDERLKHIAPRIEGYLKRMSTVDLAVLRDIEPSIVFHAEQGSS